MIKSTLHNYITILHFYSSIMLRINFYSKEGGAIRLCPLCDITSALGAPFRRSRAVLFFHFRTPRSGQLHFICAAATVFLCRSCRRLFTSAEYTRLGRSEVKWICGSFTAGFYSFAPRSRFYIALLTLFTNSPKWRTRTSTSRSYWRRETASTRPSYTP